MEGLRNLLRSRSFIWKYNKESLERFKLGNCVVRIVLERLLWAQDGKKFSFHKYTLRIWLVQALFQELEVKPWLVNVPGLKKLTFQGMFLCGGHSKGGDG